MHEHAPELDVTAWLNAPTEQRAPITLVALRGRVVVIEAFQMLCPGCVANGLPQAQRVHDTFPRDEVAVLGLHTVFEHHAAQGTEVALAAFLHEYHLTFPVGMDRPGDDGTGLPRTMARYAMRGTPTLILLDRAGRLRRQTFGHVPDLRLGADIMALMREPARPVPVGSADEGGTRCDEEGCRIGP